jgi:hypothetical protein
MMTSLAALTLEVYYRYLPLYKLDKESGDANPPADAVKPEKAKPPKTEKQPEPEEPEPEP